MIRPATKQAYRLLHDGARALAEVESVGMRVDEARLDRTIGKVGERIGLLADRLKADEAWKAWRKRYGAKASLGSRVQLGVVLYDVLGYDCKSYTSGGKTGRKRPKVDEAELARIDLPFVSRWLEAERLKKLRSTYLNGIKRETVDGLVHAVFNLHFARSYRSSCDTPNLQNQPIREKMVGKLVRRCIVPRKGNVLVEVDYDALEFKASACHWHDENMIAYASDPNLDIHRDMAAECYMIDGEVPKDVRFFAKNQFVFPTLYGSYYLNCARNLWNVIESGDLRTADGVPLREHLADRGIDGLGRCDPRREPERGTFEAHVRNVEQGFHERFPQWADRKEKWQRRYQRRGWFRTMTGFVCSGLMTRNQLYNLPIQGPAFHLLLWSLTKLVLEELRKRRMKSRVVCQIHDSMLADVPEGELDDYLELVTRVMTEDVRKAWSWIAVPLTVEAEVARGSWWEKKEV